MKTYVKPDVYYEDFELSHSVASCHVQIEGDVNAHQKETCYFDIGDIHLFDETNRACNLTPDNTQYEGYCYQTGAGVNNFFAS